MRGFLNRGHPQAQGLQALWIADQSQGNGPVWYDYCNQLPATLTSMSTVGTNGLDSKIIAPGHNASMLFDGTGYCSAGTPSQLNFNGPAVCYACLFNAPSISTTQLILGDSNSGHTTEQGTMFLGSSNLSCEFGVGNGTISGSTTLTSNTWILGIIQRWGVAGGSTWNIEILFGTTTKPMKLDFSTSSMSGSIQAQQTFSIGREGARAAAQFAGRIAMVAAWNRRKLGAELEDFRRLAFQGYHGFIGQTPANRITQWYSTVPPAGGNRIRRVICSGGS